MEPEGSWPSSWKPATKLFPEPGASSPHHAILFRIHFSNFFRSTERSLTFKFSNQNAAWNFCPIGYLQRTPPILSALMFVVIAFETEKDHLC